MQTDSMREKLFTIRMTEEERERAERLANHHGLNVAGLLRMLLKKEEREIIGGAGESENFRAACAEYLGEGGAKKPGKPDPKRSAWTSDGKKFVLREADGTELAWWDRNKTRPGRLGMMTLMRR